MALSEVWQSLKKGYKEVNTLHKDVHPPVFSRQDWAGSVFARNSLGEGSEIEVGFLVEHFLLAWNDWHTLLGRYLLYYGRPEIEIPKSWWNLNKKCHSLCITIFENPSFYRRVTKKWIPRFNEMYTDRGHLPTIRSIYHAFVENHRMMEVLYLPMRLLQDGVERKTPIELGRVVPEITDVLAMEKSHYLVAELDGLPRRSRDECHWHLRQYRHATLCASWLMLDPVDRLRPVSALMKIVKSEDSSVPDMSHLFAKIQIEDALRPTVEHILTRIQNAVAEFGYGNFVADIASGDFYGGDDSPVGSADINLIPGQDNGICNPTLLAVSKSDKRGLDFANIMKQVREHLIRCTDQTKVVIILCDHWKPDMLTDHIGDLRAHHDRGVRFLFLMVGEPERLLAPVAVDLGAAP